MKQSQENIEAAIKTQMEYYFGDKNYFKDSYLQKQ